MTTMNRSILALATLTALLVGACGQAPTETTEPDPAIVEAIDGSALKRVTLSDDAAVRIGIETASVTTASAGRLEVPSASVLYDQNGQAWVYTNPEGRVFVRSEISILGTSGEQTLLSAGPPPETRVVTVGVAELYGTELGVGDPE
jgi:starvation-inducible outer membrane lipoprotein